MNIIYLSSACSKNQYEKLFKDKSKSIGWQSNKFNKLFAEGLAENNCKVTMLSSRLINRKVNSKTIFKAESDKEENVEYQYIPFINAKGFRQICIYLNSKKIIKKWIKENQDGIIFCDILNFMLLKAAISVSKNKNTKVVGVVTDLPEILEGKTKKVEIHNKMIEKCNAFVFLSEEMNKKINVNKKPYIVIEGFCDTSMKKVENNIENKNNVIMYAGCTHKKYGIVNLVEAFKLLTDKSLELHIYGSGDSDDYLRIESQKNDKIKFFGVKSNQEVIEAEIKSRLLVNPRPLNEEFVKYSFPSKNMEYIVSGTPMLTTNLPAMPTEYHSHCYIIKDNEIENIKNAIEYIFSQKMSKLHEFGLETKEWALKNKNKKVMAGKVVDFIKKGDN